MEDQHGWTFEQYGVQLIYHTFLDHEGKVFNVSLELRDYEKRYLVNCVLSEEMFMDLISKYSEAKDAGYAYDNRKTITKKGKNMQ